MKTLKTCEDINLCPVQKAMNVIGGKWKMVILWYLHKDTLRTSELKKCLPRVSEKMLIQQLRELEKDGIVERKVYPEVPPKVEYSLTEEGKKLKPLMDFMVEWGNTL